MKRRHKYYLLVTTEAAFRVLALLASIAELCLSVIGMFLLIQFLQKGPSIDFLLWLGLAYIAEAHSNTFIRVADKIERYLEKQPQIYPKESEYRSY